MRAHTQVCLVEVSGSVSFVSFCCVCSQDQPQPARPSLSQPGPGPTSRQPGRAAATRQDPARNKRETRSDRVTESHDRQVTCCVTCLVTWASSIFCVTFFSPPPRPSERARTLTVHGQSDNRANSGESLRNPTGCAHASSADFHSAGFNTKQALAFEPSGRASNELHLEIRHRV